MPIIPMPRHEEQRVLPYAPDFFFDIIADVGSYPEFLPWCVSTRVYKKREREFYADVSIGFKMLRETWTTRLMLDRPNKITADYIRGPMKHLHNEWRFTPHAEGVLVDFVLDFEFKNPLLQKLAGHMFEEAVHKMVMAFDKRAADLTNRKRI